MIVANAAGAGGQRPFQRRAFGGKTAGYVCRARPAAPEPAEHAEFADI